MKKITNIFKKTLVPTLLATALAGCGLTEPQRPVFPIAADDRVSLPTEKGSLYESVGSAVLNPCTATYLGEGSGITVAHCLEKNILSSNVQNAPKPSIGFRCNEGRPNRENCQTVAEITEIAVPEGYFATQNEEDRIGLDVAFIRLKEDHLPPARFSLSDIFGMEPVKQAGYGMDRPGLSGDLHCTILPPPSQDHAFFRYQIRTDCVNVPGGSGGPLFNQQDRIIGLNKATAFDAQGRIAESYATPVTPELKKAFEQFKNGALTGKTRILGNGVKLTEFPYTRTPVTYSAP